MTPKSRIRDVAADNGLVGGPFGSSLVGADYVETGIPVIRGNNLSSGPHVGGDFVFVSPEKFSRDLRRNSAKPGDLIYTQRGTLGQVAIVAEGIADTYVISQSQMRLRVDPAIAHPRFVYYASSTAQFRKQVLDNAISTGVPHINLGILGNLEIPLPPLSEQVAIAEVLGALDDKIAANSRAARTADELVRARWTNACRATSEVRHVGDLAETVRELVSPDESDGAFVGLEHLPRRHFWLSDWGITDGVTSTKSRFRVGDILFGKLRPYFHKVVVAPVDGVCSTDILVLRPRHPDLAGATLAVVGSDLVVDRSTAASEGTRMPRASWKDVAAIEVPWPGDETARSLSQEITAIRLVVDAQAKENAMLAATRDAILPALMSGKLRVRDAERVVAEAV